MRAVSSVAELEALYGAPGEASAVKELDHVSAPYRRYIEASPFVLLATVGPEGLDCSPRGDRGAAVRIVDERTLLLPDRRGNNRIDSLRNIVRDPRVALLFLVPGVTNTLRVNGRAEVLLDDALQASFAVEGAAPRCVVRIQVQAVYFQCARALLRGGVWDPAQWSDPAALPSAGEMLTACTGGTFDGRAYDQAWPERAKRSMW